MKIDLKHRSAFSGTRGIVDHNYDESTFRLLAGITWKHILYLVISLLSVG